MIIYVGVRMMRSQFKGSMLVVVLRAVKFLPFSLKRLKRLAVQLVKIWLWSDMRLVSYGLMMLHGRLRVSKGHACGSSGVLVVLLELCSASVLSSGFLPCVVFPLLVSEDVGILV